VQLNKGNHVVNAGEKLAKHFEITNTGSKRRAFKDSARNGILSFKRMGNDAAESSIAWRSRE